MSQLVELGSDERDEGLAAAIADRTPVALTCKGTAGWCTLQSRFLDVDVQGGHLILEPPTAAGAEDVAFEAQQEVGASFRRGSRRYVFNATVADALTAAAGPSAGSARLRLHWPAGMQELQRRLYRRTSVPEGYFIPVDLWLSSDADDDLAPAGNQPSRGTMLDLGGGGLSLALFPGRSSGWAAGDRLTCRFAVQADGPPVEIPAIYRWRARLHDGRNRVGLQFLDLQTSAPARATLRRIHRLTTHLRQSQGRRRT